MTRASRMTMSAVDPILDRNERGLIERALAWLRVAQSRDSAMLWAQLKRVAAIGEALEQAPSLRMPSTLGAVNRDEASLAAELAQLDPMAGELRLPEKAIVARGFVYAKIALLRGFLTAVAPGAPGAEASLWAELRAELAQSIYTLIATEILIALLFDRRIEAAQRMRAARELMLIWDRAAQLEIDEFCPILEATWKARSHVSVGFGAMVGVGEYLRLAHEDCPSEFLDYFGRDDVSEDELQAFDEFLFGLPHEDLLALRAAMQREGKRVVDAGFVATTLGRSLDDSAVDDPEALYASYRRRRAAADVRAWTGASGPRRVAESYIMIYVLEARRT